MWTIYRLPVQDDGTDGTPDHNCPLRNDGTGHGPCIGDYPHIGADANGFYITTNEYAFFPDNIYMSAQIYAFSKSALASGAANVAVTQFDTTGAVNSVTGPSRASPSGRPSHLAQRTSPARTAPSTSSARTRRRRRLARVAEARPLS